MPSYPVKHIRRTATSVTAGAFERRPQRDVLTSLLNVDPDSMEDIHQAAEASTSKLPAQDGFWRERRDSVKRKGKERAVDERGGALSASKSATPVARTTPFHPTQPTASASFTFRPSINVVQSGRAMSRTPSVSPESTPGPSDASTISRTSSKRPRTPRDDEDLPYAIYSPTSAPPRKVHKPATRKGWKGWVEVEEVPESERLINLDRAVVLADRVLRSGKNFHGAHDGPDWGDSTTA